jgi:hypothetical protein
MKNLILLFLVIGAAVCTEITLTNTTGDHLWKLTYLATTTGQTYSFTLSYTKPSVAATAASTLITFDNSIGVVCVPTLPDFSFVTTVARSAFIFSVTNPTGTGAGSSATNDATTNWGPLVLTYAAGGVYVTTAGSVTFSPGAAGFISNCPLITPAALPVIANGIVTYTFAIANACISLPKMGTAWSAKCFAVIDSVPGNAPQLATLTTAANAIVGAMDVTVAGTTTTCATSGASTFATGATILAGIAYLQF